MEPPTTDMPSPSLVLILILSMDFFAFFLSCMFPRVQTPTGSLGLFCPPPPLHVRPPQTLTVDVHSLFDDCPCCVPKSAAAVGDLDLWAAKLSSTLFMARDQSMICVIPELLDLKSSGQNHGGKRATSWTWSHSVGIV